MKTNVLFICALLLLCIGTVSEGAVRGVSLDTLSRGIGIDDFDRDGNLDFVNVGIDGNIYLHYRVVEPSVLIGSVPPFGTAGGDVGTGDFNGDTWPDFVLANESSLIFMFMNGQNGTFVQSSIACPIGEIIAVDCADMNADGCVDIVAAAYNQGAVVIVAGDCTGQFGAPVLVNVALPCELPSIFAGEFNGDAHMDFIVGQDDDGEPGAAYLYASDGQMNFMLVGEAYDTNPIDESGWDRPGSGKADAYDFDGDSHPDIIAPASGLLDSVLTQIMIFKGRGGAPFAEVPELRVLMPSVDISYGAAPPLEWTGTAFGIVGDGLTPMAYVIYPALPEPPNIVPGDVNGDCNANGLDVVYYVNYLKGGPGLIRRTDCE